jgi:hypothetical protein
MLPKIVVGGVIAAAAGIFLYSNSSKSSSVDSTNLNTTNKVIYKSKQQKSTPNVEDLEKIVGQDTAQMLALDPIWLDLVDRLGEFSPFAKDEYKEVVIAAARIVAFNAALSLNKIKLTFGTPRKFRTKLHAVIEAVRCMRAQLDLTFPSCLEDFDEVAAEIQTTHNDYNNNMYFNSLYDK